MKNEKDHLYVFQKFLIYGTIICALVLGAEKLFGQTKPAVKTGYKVVIEKDKKIYEDKFFHLSQVDSMIQSHYPGTVINYREELKQSPYYNISAYRKEIYIERKKVNKKGKLRRMGL